MKSSHYTVYALGPSLPKAIRIRHPMSSVVHMPAIRLLSLPVFSFLKVNKSTHYQGLIFTSKQAVKEAKRVFLKRGSALLPSTIVCVGKATLKESLSFHSKFIQRHKRRLRRLLRKGLITQTIFKPRFIVAHEEIQEGVFESIQKHLIPQNGPLLWISSTHARSLLRAKLSSSQFDLHEIPLYTPVPQKVKLPPTLSRILFFSCPSSVHSFFKYSSCSTHPGSIRCEAIGPITQSALTLYLADE